jgi:hypothetical protein
MSAMMAAAPYYWSPMEWEDMTEDMSQVRSLFVLLPAISYNRTASPLGNAFARPSPRPMKPSKNEFDKIVSWRTWAPRWWLSQSGQIHCAGSALAIPPCFFSETAGYGA